MMKPLLKHYEDRLKYIDAIDALDHLCWIFNCSRDIVYLDGTRFALADLFDWSHELIYQRADSIKLRFWGGPPPCKWCQGTLYSMLLDKILLAHLRKDFSKIDKLFSTVHV